MFRWPGRGALEPLGLALVGSRGGRLDQPLLAAAVILAGRLATLSVPSVRRLRALPGARPSSTARQPPVEAGD